MKNQSTSHLFMIEPEVFYSNEQTLKSNHYQYKNDKTMNTDDIKKKALIEFHALKRANRTKWYFCYFNERNLRMS